MKNPVTLEDLLKDCVVSGVFPNIRCLLAIYVIIPHAEAVVEVGFSKMGQIMTKKRCALDDESLDMLMRISHRQQPLKSHELNQKIDTWDRKASGTIEYFLKKLNFSLILNCGCCCNIFLIDVVIEGCSRKYALPEILKGQQQLLKI